MHSARDAVVKLDVKLWELVVFNHAGVRQIAQRRFVDNVTHSKAFDSLVLRRLCTAPITEDKTGVVTTVAVTSVIAPLDLWDSPRVKEQRDTRWERTSMTALLARGLGNFDYK
jgi:hypothetical protein